MRAHATSMSIVTILASLLAAGAVAAGTQADPTAAAKAASPAVAPADMHSTASPAVAPSEAPSPTVAVALPAGTEVTVERVRPRKESLPTLRFLRENLSFLRARFDRLREKPVESEATTGAIDPRFLVYGRLLEQALAASDTVARGEDERSRRHLLESIAQLADLEAQMDVMDRQLAGQRGRLDALEEDFTGHQKTALLVVVSGYPADAPVDSITVTIDDGAPLRLALSAEQRLSLRQGGVIELFHGLVEPREQVVELTLSGASVAAGGSGFVTLFPARQRLTLLRFNLSGVGSWRGVAGIRASTWLQERRAGSVGG